MIFGKQPAGRIGENSGISQETVSAAVTHSHDEGAAHLEEEGKRNTHRHEKEETTRIQLSPEEKADIGLKTVIADLRPIENVIRVSGVVKPDPDKEAQVSSRVSGKIVSLFFKVGDTIQRGQRLAEIQSAEIQKLQVDLIQAENKLILHKAELDRIQRLVESKIAAQKEIIAAQNQHQADLNEIEPGRLSGNDLCRKNCPFESCDRSPEAHRPSLGGGSESRRNAKTKSLC